LSLLWLREQVGGSHVNYAARLDYILFSVLQSITLLVMAAKASHLTPSR